tara:strand:- start:59 stop:520 length:462 start_codon:yes stop_codon:yes gene_type:complete
MDTSITGTYIGSCWDMSTRLKLHASTCYNENDIAYKYPLYKYIRENGDFHTFTMKVIDSGECEDRTELECGEQFYIDMAGGIDNLLNGKDALQDKQKRKEKNYIAGKNNKKKNIETKQFPCETCGFYFPSNFKLQEHLKTPTHKKKLSQVVVV